MRNRRFRTEYNFSKRAEEVRDLLKEMFPFARMYVEYPYTRLLKRYYKRNNVKEKHREPYLLSLTRLKADFVLPDFDIIIEVDGEQHFKPVQFGGIGYEQALDNFEEQKHRDSLKLRMAKEMECKLVRIPYNAPISKESLYEEIGDFDDI